MIGTLDTPAPHTGADVEAATSVARLDALSARLEMLLLTLEPAVALVQQAPPMIAMAVDSFDALVADGRKHGIDVDQRLKDTLTLIERLTAPETMRVLGQLLAQLPAIASLLPMLDAAPSVLAEAQRTAQPAGLGGTLRALRDPDVQRAVGVTLAAARVAGRQLRTGAPHGGAQA
jgi:uncharacterized protein YjgD (DUF1641 family)